MKKISRRNFLKVSGAMAAAGALAACGGSGASTPAASGAASTSTAASAAAAGEDKFASLGDFTMTVGHAQPEGNPRFVSMEQFAADVAEATNGHVKIEVYGNGQLGTEKEMLEQVVAGTVQGMRGGQFDFSPRLLMFTLPFLTNTRAQVTALLQSDLAQKVCAEAEGETGTVIINLCDAGGYRQFSNSKHPIKAPADLKGLKIICWRKVSIAPASRFAVGSSNTKMDGFMAYTEANARLCFSPPDIEKILRPSSDCIFRAETVASYRSLIFLGSTPAFSKPKVISLSESILKNCDFGFWNTEPTCSAKRYISV